MKMDLRSLLSECKRWQINVRIVDEIPAERQAPFSSRVGCDPEIRTVYIKKCALDQELTGSEALHEMAHVVVGETESDEVINGMLALEFYTARRRRFRFWEDSMVNYQVSGDGTDWESAKPKRRQRVIAESLRGASKAGFLSKIGRPKYEWRPTPSADEASRSGGES